MQLVSLDIDQCPYPSIPTTLTALTRLRLVSAEKQSFAVFTSDLSSLAQLRVRSNMPSSMLQCVYCAPQRPRDLQAMCDQQ